MITMMNVMINVMINMIVMLMVIMKIMIIVMMVVMQLLWVIASDYLRGSVLANWDFSSRAGEAKQSMFAALLMFIDRCV